MRPPEIVIVADLVCRIVINGLLVFCYVQNQLYIIMSYSTDGPKALSGNASEIISIRVRRSIWRNEWNSANDAPRQFSLPTDTFLPIISANGYETEKSRFQFSTIGKRTCFWTVYDVIENDSYATKNRSPILLYCLPCKRLSLQWINTMFTRKTRKKRKTICSSETLVDFSDTNRHRRGQRNVKNKTTLYT